MRHRLEAKGPPMRRERENHVTSRRPSPAGRSRCVQSLLLVFLLIALGGLPSRARADLSETDGRFGISVPGVAWVLAFPSQGYTLHATRQRADGRGVYYMFVHARTGLNASVFLEPATACQTALACRDYYWEHRDASMSTAQGVARFERNGFALLEFLIPELAGQPIQQYHVSGHLVRDGYWIDLHLSKVLYSPPDRQHFLNFVDGLAILPKAK